MGAAGPPPPCVMDRAATLASATRDHIISRSHVLPFHLFRSFEERASRRPRSITGMNQSAIEDRSRSEPHLFFTICT
jgi:hypothetical protein